MLFSTCSVISKGKWHEEDNKMADNYYDYGSL